MSLCQGCHFQTGKKQWSSLLSHSFWCLIVGNPDSEDSYLLNTSNQIVFALRMVSSSSSILPGQLSLSQQSGRSWSSFQFNLITLGQVSQPSNVASLQPPSAFVRQRSMTPTDLSPSQHAEKSVKTISPDQRLPKISMIYVNRVDADFKRGSLIRLINDKDGGSLSAFTLMTARLSVIRDQFASLLPHIIFISFFSIPFFRGEL